METLTLINLMIKNFDELKSSNAIHSQAKPSVLFLMHSMSVIQVLLMFSPNHISDRARSSRAAAST
jgi:hypothetical protein